MTRILPLIIMLTLVLNSCYSKGSQKELVVMWNKNTEDIEAVTDLLLSIENNSDYLKKNDIKVKYIHDSNNFGYLLINNSKRMMIQSVRTDVELLSIIDKHYAIK